VSGGQSRILLATIVVIGAFLRLWDIGSQPLWSDEALTAVIAHAPPWALATKPIDPSGPIYYWVHRLFVPESGGPAAMRAISALCGILIIPMTYALGRQLLERKGSLLAAALVSLSFPLIDYSQEARAYSLLTLLFCVAGWLAMRAASEENATNRRWLLAEFCVVSTAALYTHFVAFLFTASILLVFPGMIGRPALRRGEVYATIAGVALLGAAEAWRIFTYAKVGSGFNWLQQCSIAECSSLLAREWLPGATTGLVGLALLALFAAGMFYARHQFATMWRSRPAALAVLLVWLAQPFFLWVFGLIFTPVLMQRTMLPSWPAFALMLAFVLGAFSGRAWLIAAFGSLLLYAGTLVLTGLSRPKEEWSEMAEQVSRTNSGAVIVCAHWKAPAALAALRRSPRPMLVYRHEQWQLVGGDHADAWPKRYADAFWLREIGLRQSSPQTLGRSLINLRSVTLLESECSDTALIKALDRLNGRLVGSWRSDARIERGSAFGQPAPISVKALEFSEPVQLRVLRLKN